MKRKSRRAQTSAHPHRVAAQTGVALRARPAPTAPGSHWRHGDPPRDGRRVPGVPADDRERVPRGRHRRGRSRPGRRSSSPSAAWPCSTARAMVATAAIFTRELTLPGGADERRRRHRGRRARRPTAAAACSPPHAPPDRRRARRGRVRRGAVGVRGRDLRPLRLRPRRPPRFATVPTAGARLQPGLPAPDGRTCSSSLPTSSRGSPRCTTASAASAPATSTARAHGGTGASPTPSSTVTAATRCAPRSTKTHDGTVDGYALYGVSSTGTTARTRRRRSSSARWSPTAPPRSPAIWSYLIGLDLTRSIEAGHSPRPTSRSTRPPPGPAPPARDARVEPLGPARRRGRRARGADLRGAVRRSSSTSTTRSARGTPAATGSSGTAPSRPASAPTPRPTSRSRSTDLGAAYLGGTSLAALAAIGRVRELRPGALEPVATRVQDRARAVVPGDLLGGPTAPSGTRPR